MKRRLGFKILFVQYLNPEANAQLLLYTLSALECPAPTHFWLDHWCKSDIDALRNKTWTIFNLTGHFLNSRKENVRTWCGGKDVHLTHVYVKQKLKIEQTERMHGVLTLGGKDGFIRQLTKAFQPHKKMKYYLWYSKNVNDDNNESCEHVNWMSTGNALILMTQ